MSEFKNIAEDLQARGLVEHTSAELEDILGTPRTVYLGVDPSADSMQAGNLVLVLLVKRLADAGHKPILLAGGGTGMIGDPKEKGERPLADASVVARNVEALRAQMQQIVGGEVPVVNNADWLLEVKLVDFLRDIGKHFTVNEMIKRDIIRRRLETPDESISYTEFAYGLLQGYDFLELYQTRGVDLQVGGTDQWTNILSGVELIRRKLGKEAFALTCPLVTDANGKKFGKSEGNAVWLSAEKTSPFQFYQFWLNQPDEKIETYLKFYTFLSISEIEEVMARHHENPGAREAQSTLAHEVTTLVHGTDATISAERITEALFGNSSLEGLLENERRMLVEGAPSLAIEHELVSALLSELLLASSLVASKREAKQFIEDGAVTLNGEKVDADRVLTDADFVNNLALLARGKKNKVVLYRA